jgi:hypothetical protein
MISWLMRPFGTCRLHQADESGSRKPTNTSAFLNKDLHIKKQQFSCALTDVHPNMFYFMGTCLNVPVKSSAIWIYKSFIGIY